MEYLPLAVLPRRFLAGESSLAVAIVLSSRCLRAAGLAVFIAAGIAGCRPIPEDAECGEMREIGLSGKKNAIIREWIAATLADPNSLARSAAKPGRLFDGRLAAGLDWEGLEVHPDRMIIGFDVQNLDYTSLDRSAIEAVIIGRGNGYKLIFKLNPNTDIEARLIEASKRPYGDIEIETLAPDLLLVCQVNQFG